MQMAKALREYLSLVPPERPFLLDEQGEALSYGAVLKLTDDTAKKYAHLNNARGAIVSDSSYTIALLLPALNSLLSCVYLQAQDITPEHAKRIYKAAKIDFIIELSEGKIKNITRISEDTPFANHDDANSQDICTWLLATSGTTGEPKLLSYTLDTLFATSSKNIDVGQKYRWGLCYEPNRFAGLQVYLQAIASGSSLLVASDLSNTSALLSVFTRANVNSISATPSLWRKFLMSPEHALLSLSNITLGGEISQQTLLNSLGHAFPKAHIIHIYASTEAGVSITVKDKKAGFPSAWLNKSKSLPVELKVINKLLWIKTQFPADNILLGKLSKDSDGFINTGDMVEVLDERVQFLGRENGSINVGGNKVMPEKVENVLLAHPEVLMARCYAKTNSILGSLVCADIVLKTHKEQLDNKALKRNLKFFCKGKLNTFEIPATFNIVQTVATNINGKIRR